MGKVIRFDSAPRWSRPPEPACCIVCGDTGVPCGCVLRAALVVVKASWWRRALAWLAGVR
jgi:hypothetical protein